MIPIPLVAGYLARSRWVWLLAGSVLLLAAGWAAYWWADRAGYQRARAEQAALDERQRAVDAAWRADVERQHQETVHATQDRLARVRADAAAADRAAVQLRDAYARAVALGCPAAAEGGAAAASAPGVLADVLRELDSRLRTLGRVADERGAAGAACESAYDTLR